MVLPLGQAKHKSTHPPAPLLCPQNCVHSDAKLWLIFEWVDQDLKRYMNSCKSNLDPMLIKVRYVRVSGTSAVRDRRPGGVDISSFPRVCRGRS